MVVFAVLVYAVEGAVEGGKAVLGEEPEAGRAVAGGSVDGTVVPAGWVGGGLDTVVVVVVVVVSDPGVVAPDVAACAVGCVVGCVRGAGLAPAPDTTPPPVVVFVAPDPDAAEPSDAPAPPPVPPYLFPPPPPVPPPPFEPKPPPPPVPGPPEPKPIPFEPVVFAPAAVPSFGPEPMAAPPPHDPVVHPEPVAVEPSETPTPPPEPPNEVPAPPPDPAPPFEPKPPPPPVPGPPEPKPKPFDPEADEVTFGWPGAVGFGAAVGVVSLVCARAKEATRRTESVNSASLPLILSGF